MKTFMYIVCNLNPECLAGSKGYTEHQSKYHNKKRKKTKRFMTKKAINKVEGLVANVMY